MRPRKRSGSMELLVGLSDFQAQQSLERYGKNEPSEKPLWELCWQHVGPILRNPLILLLAGLGGIAYWSGDAQTGQVIWAMMGLAVGMQVFQEFKGERAAALLKESLRTKCRVLRGRYGRTVAELDARDVVPGDLVLLSAGDLVPADGVIVFSAHLQVNQSQLTGESIAVEKHAAPPGTSAMHPTGPELSWIVLAGSLVVAGHGAFRVEKTGDNTEVGRIVAVLNDAKPRTRFDQDMERFTWMMIRFIFILAPLVVVLQSLRQGLSLDTFMYAVSVSVGLAPEMLPMILTACLVHGASQFSQKHQCIVKRMNAMQSLGTIDILCSDKTGTLTEDSLAVNRSVDSFCSERSMFSFVALGLAKINAHFMTGTSNNVEKAIQASVLADFPSNCDEWFELLDETPFDYVKRYAAVTVRSKHTRPEIVKAMQGKEIPRLVRTLVSAGLCEPGTALTIVKGAVEEMLALCTHYGELLDGLSMTRQPISRFDMEEQLGPLRKCGERILAVAVSVDPEDSDASSKNLVLIGFITFTDPPKETSAPAVMSMHSLGVSVRMLTGDTSSVAAHVAKQVGIRNPNHVVEGKALENLPRNVLQNVLRTCYVFARLTPAQKKTIVSEYKAMGHSVGFVGDGVNDVAALQASDVAISVESACDAARSAADILLTQKNLAILEPAVLQGRRVFLNMVKYLKMAASSNFGNMFSVVGASLLIPFIPMLPIQVVTSNFLYDVAQLGIPTDCVDTLALRQPFRLSMPHLQRFIVLVGFLSSVFDYITFGVLYFFLGGDEPTLFRTGWFLEGLLSQTLVVFVLRATPGPSKGNPRGRSQSPPSKTLLALSLGVCLSGILLTQLPSVQTLLFFTPLPTTYWLALAIILPTYLASTRLLLQSIPTHRNLLFTAAPSHVDMV